MQHTYDTTFEAFDESLVGSIEIRVYYTYTSGRPARIRYDEHDHPAEPPEIEIVNVEMEIPDGDPVLKKFTPTRDALYQNTKWTRAFEWLFEWAENNVDADELIAKAEDQMLDCEYG